MNSIKRHYLNLPIRKKIIYSIGIIVVLSMLLLIMNNAVLKVVSDKYDQAISGAEYRYSIASDINAIMAKISKNVTTVRFNYNNKSAINIAEETINSNMDDIFIYIDEYIDSSESEFGSTDEDYEIQMLIIDDLVAALDEYVVTKDNIIQYGKNADLKSLMTTDIAIAEQEEAVSGYIDELMYISYEESAESSNEAYTISYISTIWVIIIGIIVVLISIILGLTTSSIIVKPIKVLTELSTKVAKGDFDIDLSTNVRDEIGKLSNNINDIIYNFKMITEQIIETHHQITEGSLSARIDADAYEGAYNETATSVNDIIDIFGNDTWTILDSIKEYANGNFDSEPPEFKGEKQEFCVQLDKFRMSLKNINTDLAMLIGNVIEGNFKNKIDETQYTGDWKNIAENLNTLVVEVEKPVTETCRILKEIEKANFNVHFDGEYNGDFAIMQNALNSTVEQLRIYIKDISKNLTSMADKNLNVSVDIDYEGDFDEIKKALNLIINNFNILIRQLEDSSEQVATGANSIASTSSDLASGASTQSESIHSMSTSFGKINEKTKECTVKSIEANKITESAKEKLETENEEMKSMVDAMAAISVASSNISGIIQVIEEIAFQTNILALNAAIEAARAGQYGKGFSVVADEVRTLAMRSQKAVKETENLINITLEKVQQGTEIADNTAKQINEISLLVDSVAEIVNGVNVLSQEQYELVTDMNKDIKQISDVVNTNSSTSEQSAAASQELASMATVLKDYVSAFKLKK